MNDRPDKHPSDETVAKWVRELPDAQPDPAFRDRLRSAFVSGEIDRERPAAEASRERRPARPRARVSSPGRRWWAWAGPALAAAAAAFVFITLNRGPALELLAASGAGTVVIDGRSMDITDAASIGEAVHPGAVVEVPEGASLDLGAARTALYEVAGGTRMTLPDTPGRWFHRAVACTVMVGELRLKTGPRFPGARLDVFTPDGVAVVTGTLLSVQCDEGGTCVCVLEGVAHVGVDEHSLEAVSPGFRKVMLKDGTREIIPVKPMHRDGVLDFDRRMGNRMDE